MTLTPEQWTERRRIVRERLAALDRMYPPRRDTDDDQLDAIDQLALVKVWAASCCRPSSPQTDRRSRGASNAYEAFPGAAGPGAGGIVLGGVTC